MFPAMRKSHRDPAPRDASHERKQIPPGPTHGNSTAVVCAEQVRKRFGSLEVLKGVDLTVGTGDVMCLVGPSGSGKSTLLRCINHLESIDGGRLRVNGELVGYRERGGKLYELKNSEVGVRRQRIGMVFQQFNLFGHMTALENITAAPIWVKKEPRKEAVAFARELLDKVGLSEKADAYPNTLSGGQQQRVAIARALAMRPVLMLLDEPTSALDPELVGDVLDVMRALAESGITMVVATHEMSFAREVGTSVVVMDEGQVVESGHPRDVLLNPQTPRTRAFLSRLL